MSHSFVFTSNPARILFGSGRIAELGAEMERLGKCRALLLSTPFQKADVEKLAEGLGARAAGVFSNAAMHTPVDVTEHATAVYAEARADCLVAFGGGSTIGLGKAIAYRNDAPQIVVATTYAGSEVTPILGQTENGLKTTVRSLSILPETVIYDPSLTLGLPVLMSVTSGLNAIAHAAEGLYAQDRNPVASMMALEGIGALRSALPKIVANPLDLDARSDALYGSWLCGSVLGMVGMALHHKLCHTLGGTFDLPHAETHSVLLPHTIAYTEEAVPHLLSPLAALFNAEKAGKGLFNFAVGLGAPIRLSDLGLKETDLGRAAELATTSPYWNPRPVERKSIRDLLQRAWAGTMPD